MIRPQTRPQPERVADWPRITASVRPDGTGSLTINGTEHPCRAASVEELRTGIIARCAAIAVRLHRPVRVAVTDDLSTWTLAVRPEGIVQLLDESGVIPSAAGLSIPHGYCRRCRRIQPVTATQCLQCGITEPHRVETGPLDVEAAPPSDR